MTHARGTRVVYGAMQTVFGLLGLLGFVIGILVLSSAATALVVKISPTPASKAAKSADS
jgi:hypothetical protein